MTNKTKNFNALVSAISEMTDTHINGISTENKPTQLVYSLGEIFLHNGRSVQVVELQAEGVYHVKSQEAPFDSYWVNTGEAVDITNVTDAE